MNDKWLNDVRKSMADYETDEPAELWAGLEKEIARQNLRPSLFARAKRYIAAAAAVVIAFTAGVYILTRQDSITDSPLTADNDEPSALVIGAPKHTARPRRLLGGSTDTARHSRATRHSDAQGLRPSICQCAEARTHLLHNHPLLGRSSRRA